MDNNTLDFGKFYNSQVQGPNLPTPTQAYPTVPTQMNVKDIQGVAGMQGNLQTSPPPPVANNIPQYTEAVNGAVKLQEEQYKAAQEQVKQQEEQMGPLRDLYLQTGLQADTANQQYQQGLQKQFQDLNNFKAKTQELQNQLNSYNTETDNALRQMEVNNLATGGTTGSFQDLQSRLYVRERDIRANQLKAQVAAATGQQALAQDAIQTYIQSKYNPAEEKLKTLERYLNLNQKELERADTKAYKAQENYLGFQRTALDNAKSTDEKIQNIMTSIAPFAPNDIVQKVAGAKSVAEAINLASQYISPDKALELKEKLTEYNSKYGIPDATNTTLSDFKNAIAAVESRGSGDYNAVGPVTAKGNRAYGRYQVMDFNIPNWTREALGTAMSVDQFKRSPQAQEQVADYMFNKLYQQYGNWDDVASVWFSGRPMSNNISADVTGTSVPDYINKYRKNLTGGGTSQTTVMEDVVKKIGKENASKLYSIGKDYKADKIVQKFVGLQDAVKAISVINAGSKNPADHQALVYNFAKALDPDSVVREGEYATIKKYSQGLLDRFEGEINQAINGTGFLSEQAIKDIQTAMNNRLRPTEDTYNNIRQDYIKQLGLYSNNPQVAETMIPDFRKSYSANSGGGTNAVLSEFGL